MNNTEKKRRIRIISDQSVQMDPAFPLVIVRDQQEYCVPHHEHTFTEIVFVAEGSARHTFMGRCGGIRHEGLIQGDLFSVLKGESHEFRDCGRMVLYNIYLHDTVLAPYRALSRLPSWPILFERSADSGRRRLHLSSAERTTAARCLDKAIREEKLRREGFETVVVALFLEFLVTALRKTGTDMALGENSYGVLESISLMEANPESPFSLEKLAKVSCMSVASYTQKFRAATGLSPMNYLLKVRLDKARDLLTLSDFSIGEIAERCGFCSANYMIRRFREDLGITPAQFRKELRKGMPS